MRALLSSGHSKTLPLVLLVAANLVPLLGVMFLGWSVASILVVYWVESVVIGVLNIPRILATDGPLGGKLFMSGFFAVHYGGFALGHAVFLNSLFDAGSVFAELRDYGALFWSALGLGVSHLISLMIRLSRREFADKTPNEQMFAPYGRVMIMHVVVLFGGIGLQSFGEPIIALLLLIGIKTVLDIGAHCKETQVNERQSADAGRASKY